MNAGRDEQKTVTLRHPTLNLEVVVWEEVAVVLRRYGYTDVADKPADVPSDSENEERHDGQTGQ